MPNRCRLAKLVMLIMCMSPMIVVGNPRVANQHSPKTSVLMFPMALHCGMVFRMLLMWFSMECCTQLGKSRHFRYQLHGVCGDDKVSDFVNMLKTNTSRLLRRDFSEQLAKVYSGSALWSHSYCVISVGGAPLEVLRRYIEQQERPD